MGVDVGDSVVGDNVGGCVCDGLGDGDRLFCFLRSEELLSIMST